MTGLGDLGRLQEPSMLVLVSLSGGPKHGYAIQSDIRAFSGADIGPGTLYAILPRLEGLGLIEALPSVERRRPYRISALGADLLRGHLDRLRTVSDTGLARLEETG